MTIIIFMAGLFIGIMLGALTMIFAQLKRSSEENGKLLSAKEATIANHDV